MSEKQAVEQELAKLREQASRNSSIEEVLSKLTANNEKKPDPETPATSGLSAEAVAELVRKELQAVNSQAQAAKNYEEVQNSLKSKFADKTREVVAAKARELGTTVEQLGELSKQSQLWFLALFGTQKSTVSPTTPSSYRLLTQPIEPDLSLRSHYF